MEKDKPDSDENTVRELNLFNIASNILEPKKSNLALITADIIDSEKSSNMVIVTDKAVKQESLISTHLKKIAENILEKEEEINKIETKNDNLNIITSGIIESNVKNQNNLQIIEKLTSTLIDLKYKPEFSLSWLLAYMNILHDLNVSHSIRSAFNSWTLNAIYDLKSDSHDLSSIPSSIVINLAKDIPSRESVDADKLIDFVDKYVNDMVRENKMNSNDFVKLVSTIPKEKRSSFDLIANLVIDLLNAEKHNSDSEEQNQMLNLIDFNKLNEVTLAKCDSCEFIPQKYVTKAALNLCTKLRKQLNESNMVRKNNYYDDYNTTMNKIDIEPAFSTTKYPRTNYSHSCKTIFILTLILNLIFSFIS